MNQTRDAAVNDQKKKDILFVYTEIRATATMTAEYETNLTKVLFDRDCWAVGCIID
jgi:hypothetical protein